MLAKRAHSLATLPVEDHVVRPLCHVRFTEEPQALGALARVQLLATIEAAAPEPVPHDYRPPVDLVRLQVALLRLADLPRADLLAVGEPVTVLLAEATSAVLAGGSCRPATVPECVLLDLAGA